MPVGYSLNRRRSRRAQQGGLHKASQESQPRSSLILSPLALLVLDLSHLSRGCRACCCAGSAARSGGRRLLEAIAAAHQRESSPRDASASRAKLRAARAAGRCRQSIARRPRPARHTPEGSRAALPAPGRDGARRGAGTPREHRVRQRPLSRHARDERRRGGRQVARGVRQRRNTSSWWKAICAGVSPASPRPSATRSSWSVSTAR